MKIMKAVTVYQPWATLIVIGAKPWEFRKWSLRERGGSYADLIGQRVVIHAAARKVVEAEVDDIVSHLLEGGEFEARTCLDKEKALKLLLGEDLGKLPLSAGVGTAVVGEPRTGEDIAAELGIPFTNDSDRNDEAKFGWPMLEVEAWEQPVPMRGAQGFWNWPTPADAGL